MHCLWPPDGTTGGQSPGHPVHCWIPSSYPCFVRTATQPWTAVLCSPVPICTLLSPWSAKVWTGTIPIKCTRNQAQRDQVVDLRLQHSSQWQWAPRSVTGLQNQWWKQAAQTITVIFCGLSLNCEQSVVFSRLQCVGGSMAKTPLGRGIGSSDICFSNSTKRKKRKKKKKRQGESPRNRHLPFRSKTVKTDQLAKFRVENSNPHPLLTSWVSTF